ncbi:ATP-binding cassette domain-containing protein [Microtetraspora niveoalba]|uniref:ATP-binding cassette domain-containing protein n=1 Tax=Microtetraspora niveoalba TaxID=46175 RepID=UPI00082CBA8D|nr:ATP-binding cassette domain-containing protein [Microtetraspora niveoalba]
MPVVEAEGLAQGYGAKEVIPEVTLSVSVGITGLLGPNGAGKTTLLRTLATVAPPRRGRLAFLGQELRSEREIRKARRNIGFLPQDFGYFASFTAYEFVNYCAWLREVPRKVRPAAVSEALERVGLSSRARTKMGALSGGMLRRAGIAQAIVAGPRLVLLDEPTVGLDPEQRLDFRELLKSLVEDDTAVLLSTHLVEDVAAVCGDLLVLSDGKIVFAGRAQALENMANPDAKGDTPLERGYMTVLKQVAHQA